MTMISHRDAGLAAAVAMAVGLALAAPFARAELSDGDWFLHEFAELRSYHGDWLAVCDAGGAGDCRLVQYLFEPGAQDRFFGEARLSVESDPGGASIRRIEIFERGAPDEPPGAVGLVIGGRAWSLRPGAEIGGARTASGGVIAESFEITASALLAKIDAAMREGRWLRLGYRQDDDQARRLRFSLRGYAEGVAAIKALEARRPEE